jgi:hypothetical protein
MKKLLTIPGYKGNANENHIKIAPTLLEWLLLRTQTTTNVGEKAGKKEPSHTAGGNVSYNNYGKHYGGSFKNKNRSAI